MLRTYRLLISGSARLSPSLVEFTEILGEEIIENTDLILVTGGLKSLTKGVPTVDASVVAGALRKLEAIHLDPSRRIWTLLPEHEFAKAERFDHGRVILVRHSGLRSRRYAMVCDSDAVITIEGHKATKEIIDLAWVLQKPLLPLPFTGGDSADRWAEYKGDLMSRLPINDDEVAMLESGADDARQLARLALLIVKRRLKPRCFVAMVFGDHPVEDIYSAIQEIVHGAGYSAVRVDEISPAGNVVTAIWESIRTSDILIADITRYSPNVFYELGISHALGKTTIIILHSADGKVPRDIPFDISVEQILPYTDQESLKARLLDALQRIDASGGEATV